VEIATEPGQEEAINNLVQGKIIINAHEFPNLGYLLKKVA
jgi:hypothetical protein